MQLLAGKVAIVTGASSGIGRAAAVMFVRHGARVVVAARRGAALQELVASIADEGGTAHACAGDVRDERFMGRLVDTASREFGGLDVAFNSTMPGPSASLARCRRCRSPIGAMSWQPISRAPFWLPSTSYRP
jgi:NAD(P)-dependent dehydrogenase (short-subunit alcohol dehydrogenase family)